MGAFAILNIPKIDKLLKTGNVVIDGLYSWEEYKILKEKYGENGIVIVAIVASPKIRYARREQINFDKNKDPNAVYRKASYEDSKTRDYDQIENASQGGPIAMADYFVLNESSIISLNSQLNKIYPQL